MKRKLCVWLIQSSSIIVKPLLYCSQISTRSQITTTSPVKSQLTQNLSLDYKKVKRKDKLFMIHKTFLDEDFQIECQKIEKKEKNKRKEQINKNIKNTRKSMVQYNQIRCLCLLSAHMQSSDA